MFLQLVAKGSHISTHCRPYTYKDTVPSCTSSEIAGKVSLLKAEISRLDNMESLLDIHRTWIDQSIKNTMDDLDNKNLLYVTYEELLDTYGLEETLLILNMPLDSTLKVEVRRTIIFIVLSLILTFVGYALKM